MSVPKLHDAVPDTWYPALHVGWHVEPLASDAGQLPVPPLVAAVVAAHGVGEHAAMFVSVPALHDLDPDKV